MLGLRRGSFQVPSFIFFSFSDKQRPGKNKGALNADELAALFVHVHCTHAAAFSPCGCLDRRKRRRSRSEISRIRADGWRDQRTKPRPHTRDRKFGCSFVVGTLKLEEETPAASAALTGREAAVADGYKKKGGCYRKHDPANYSFTIFFSLRVGAH